MAKPQVLFLCTGSSCRRQMAGGLLRHLAGDRFEPVFRRIRDKIGEQGRDFVGT